MSRSRPTLRAGLVPAIALASTSILAACGDGGTGPQSIDDVVITAATGGAEPQVMRGQTVQLEAQALRNGTAVQGIRFDWRTETPEVATVDTTGLVRAVDYGSAQIVAEPIGVGGVVGRLTVQVVGPPVASISILPSPAFVDPGDSIRFTAVGRDAGGQQLSNVEFTWRSTSSGLLTVDDLGRGVGQAPGTVEVEATAWNGVVGTADVRVTPVTGFSPDSGRFGAARTIQGTGMPQDARVYFNGSGNSRVEAFVRSRSSTAYEVWVPVDAVSGTLRFVAATDSFTTSRRFTVTAQDDVLEPNGCDDAGCTLAEIPIPYSNPSLVVGSAEFDLYALQITETTPISIYLVDRGPQNFSGTVLAYIARLQPIGVLSLIMPLDFVEQQLRDSVVYSHPGLTPGTYIIEIHGLSLPSFAEARRPYGLTVKAETSFELAPDGFEPNDAPSEAAPTPVMLPFDRNDLVAENPMAQDNYVFEVGAASDVTVTLAGERGDLDLVLLRGDSVGIFLGNADILALGETATSNETVTASVPAGRYTVTVVEFGGQSSRYSLQINAAPAAAAVSPFDVTSPVPASARKRPAFVLPRFGLRDLKWRDARR